MGKPKKYLIKTINFGEINNPARVLVEKFISKKCNATLSEFMRKLVIIFLSDNLSNKDYKIQLAKYEREKITEQIYKLSKMLHEQDDKLAKLEITHEELMDRY